MKLDEAIKSARHSDSILGYINGDLIYRFVFGKDNAIREENGKRAELRVSMFDAEWKIEPAEPMALSADGWMEKNYTIEYRRANNYHFNDMKHAYNSGYKKGQFGEWARPEQVELRKCAEEIDKTYGSPSSHYAIGRLHDALLNLKPPYYND